jgi:hypothetical protein
MLRRIKLTSWLAPFVFLALGLFAQDKMQNSQGNMNEGKVAGTHHMLNITGCLKRGAEPKGYYITDSNGKTWELTSKSVDLSQHINHVVSVSGHEMKVSKEQESKNEESEKSEAAGNQHFDLNVNELKMISSSCTR